MKPSDYLRFYAERFHTVEVDSTFYACPTARTVENWMLRKQMIDCVEQDSIKVKTKSNKKETETSSKA